MNIHDEIPIEVREAATRITTWMTQNGWGDDWELMGVADRNLVTKLRDQLTAEREILLKEHSNANRYALEIVQLREQLASAKATASKMAVAVEALERVNELLDKYGESEKPAVDTLNKIEAVTYDALAKLGEGVTPTT